MNQEAKRKCLNRLGRIEGQVRGVARMIGEDRYCIDIMTQITAARSALQKVEEEFAPQSQPLCRARDHVWEYR